MGGIDFGGGLVMKRWDDSGEGGVKYGVDYHSSTSHASTSSRKLEGEVQLIKKHAWFILLRTSGIFLSNSRPHRFYLELGFFYSYEHMLETECATPWADLDSCSRRPGRLHWSDEAKHWIAFALNLRNPASRGL
jgi:hypothetical protein